MYDQIEIKISSGKNTIAATKFTPRDMPVRKRIISLHGAGNAIRQRTFYLADMLTIQGGEFVCFDFSGHGESTGTLAESSLKLRKSEALDVINEVLGGEPDVIMGNSMGGYIALELLSELTPEAIILLCPAMYSSDAFDVPFTEKFTSILREPGSYRKNHAAAKLQSFSWASNVSYRSRR